MGPSKNVDSGTLGDWSKDTDLSDERRKESPSYLTLTTNIKRERASTKCPSLVKNFVFILNLFFFRLCYLKITTCTTSFVNFYAKRSPALVFDVLKTLDKECVI